MTRALALLTLVGCGGALVKPAPAPTPVVVAPAPAPPPKPKPVARPAPKPVPKVAALFVVAPSGQELWPLGCLDSAGKPAGGDDCLAGIGMSDEVRLAGGTQVVATTSRGSTMVCAMEGQDAQQTGTLVLGAALPAWSLAVSPKDASFSVKTADQLAVKTPGAASKLLQAPVMAAEKALGVKLPGNVPFDITSYADDLDGDGKPDLIYLVSHARPDSDPPQPFVAIFVAYGAAPKTLVAIKTEQPMNGQRLSLVGTSDLDGDKKRELVLHESWSGGYLLSLETVDGGDKLVHSFGCDE